MQIQPRRAPMALHCWCRSGAEAVPWGCAGQLCLALCVALEAEVDRVARMQHDPMMGRKNVSGGASIEEQLDQKHIVMLCLGLHTISIQVCTPVGQSKSERRDIIG